jgi:polyisoprenyl-teichoic acid--peptidoglycan teichoic acid transferase
MAKRMDTVRLLALIILISSILYFNFSLFFPKKIPYFLRLWPMPKNMNVLIMGTDATWDKAKHTLLKEIGRTDTMILVNLNTSSFKANMLSIPRDTVVEIPGYGWQKINSAFFLGGPELAMETVSKFLGVPVNHYVVLNTKGLARLIDLMGGINIYVDKDMYYVDNWGGLKIDLKKGWQNLNGEQAHEFIRFRQDPLGDVSRVQRQQEFLQTLLKKLATPSMVAKAPWVMAIAIESVKTDLSLKDVIYSLNFARGLRKEDINMSIVPGNFAVGEQNASIWSPDLEALKDIVNKYFSKKLLAKLEQRHAPSYSITLINNTDDFDATRQLMKLLYKQDYSIVNVPTIKKPGVDKTRIIAQKGDRTGGEKLGSILGIKDIFVSGTGDLTSDFTIIICNDWKDYINSKLSR